jgi:glycosyltransferase involved in cell wall biosynthesis
VIPSQRDPVLYVDCTSTLRSGLNTGIQKVVWALVDQADVFTEVLGIDCVPIAYQFNAFYRLVDAKHVSLETQGDFKPVEFIYRDIYLCPDAFWTMNMFRRYAFFRDHGVSIATLIYDLIPLSFQEFVAPEEIAVFEEALLSVINYSKLFFCVSHATRRDLLAYCLMRDIPLQTDRCHVIPLAPALQNLSYRTVASSNRLPEKPFFLMVGTVEPRRGYKEALREFRTYWASGGDRPLLIIGKLGGAGLSISNELLAVTEGGLPLTWLQDSEDNEVTAAYQHATAVVSASKAEGYGMSVSEGLAYNGLVLANRLPVFGEFAGSLPYYFDIDTEGDLVRLLDKVDVLKRHVVAADMGNWEETATVLARHLTRISPAHGSHTGIELDRNSPEAVRWLFWLNHGRTCDPKALEYYLTHTSVAEMCEVFQEEARRQDSELSPDLIRCAYSMILGRQTCSDDEVAFWLGCCGNLRELREHLLREAMKARSGANGLESK